MSRRKDNHVLQKCNPAWLPDNSCFSDVFQWKKRLFICGFVLLWKKTKQKQLRHKFVWFTCEFNRALWVQRKSIIACIVPHQMAVKAPFNHLPGLALLAFRGIMGNSGVVLGNQELSLRCCHLIYLLPGLNEPLRPVVGKLKTHSGDPETQIGSFI